MTASQFKLPLSASHGLMRANGELSVQFASVAPCFAEAPSLPQPGCPRELVPLPALLLQWGAGLGVCSPGSQLQPGGLKTALLSHRLQPWSSRTHLGGEASS